MYINHKVVRTLEEVFRVHYKLRLENKINRWTFPRDLSVVVVCFSDANYPDKLLVS